MCLTLLNKDAYPKIATEDIQVFKYVFLDLQKKTWRPLYRGGESLPLNVKLTAKGTYPDNRDNYVTDFGAGVFHSCGDLNTLKSREIVTESGVYAVLAIIPKGTKYFTSLLMSNICSTEIIITDIIIAGNGVTRPFISEAMLKKALVDVVPINNKFYIRVKDNTYIVFLTLDNDNEKCSINEAILRAKDAKERIPYMEDWELINKYRHQIDPLLKRFSGDDLNSAFWSATKSSISSVFIYNGMTRYMLESNRIYNKLTSRWVLDI